MLADNIILVNINTVWYTGLALQGPMLAPGTLLSGVLKHCSEDTQDKVGAISPDPELCYQQGSPS